MLFRSKLHYYDNKQRGEVDFLIDDFNSLTVLPIEVKSGKDYTIHSALTKFLSTPDYTVARAIVLCNEREVKTINGITYMPVYYAMFVGGSTDVKSEDTVIPEVPMPKV